MVVRLTKTSFHTVHIQDFEFVHDCVEVQCGCQKKKEPKFLFTKFTFRIWRFSSQWLEVHYKHDISFESGFRTPSHISHIQDFKFLQFYVEVQCGCSKMTQNSISHSSHSGIRLFQYSWWGLMWLTKEKGSKSHFHIVNIQDFECFQLCWSVESLYQMLTFTLIQLEEM